MYIDKEMYECPSCGKKYRSLEDLSQCVLKDSKAIETMKIEKAQRVKEKTYSDKVAEARTALNQAYTQFRNIVATYNATVRTAQTACPTLSAPIAEVNLIFKSKTEKQVNSLADKPQNEDAFEKAIRDIFKGSTASKSVVDVKNDLAALLGQLGF